MCLSALYLTGIQTVYCALSLDAAKPYGLSTAHIYAQLAQSPDTRSLNVRCVPITGATELYETWLKQRAQPTGGA